MSDRQILITACSDPGLWYAHLVGQRVPYLGEWPEGFKSREPAGYINLVRRTDGQLVAAEPGPSVPLRAPRPVPAVVTLRDAERYVGLPYVPGEFDCMDLAIKVQRELFGLDISALAGRSHGLGVRGQGREISRLRDTVATRSELAETGCAVLLTEPGDLVPSWHIGTGFLTGDLSVWVLHASAALGSVALQRLSDLRRFGMHLEGFYLWR